ncbi:MAG: hypothetical protein EBY43_09160, partial [Opitutae bacterium]|nr:hypothetical protein [Opitutae bacterium]
MAKSNAMSTVLLRAGRPNGFSLGKIPYLELHSVVVFLRDPQEPLSTRPLSPPLPARPIGSRQASTTKNPTKAPTHI